MDAVACDYLIINDREEVLARKNFEEPIACGIMFHTGQLIDIGLYDELSAARRGDLRSALQKYNIHRLELPLYRYRRHEPILLTIPRRGHP